MPLTVTHAFTSAKSDGADATEVRPSDWNADHVLSDNPALLDAANDFTVNGAASTPSIELTGAWYRAGDSTTAKAMLLLEEPGATSTGWAAGGTAIGVNALNGSFDEFLSLQIDGNPALVIDRNGSINTNGNIRGSNVKGNSVSTTPTTFAGLPASPAAGDRAFITDALSATVYGAPVAGGGSINLPVYFDGSDWLSDAPVAISGSSGGVLGYLYVDAQESTSSATPVDLATLDTVTFTLANATDVIIQYNCEVFSSTTTAAVNQANVDGSIVSAVNLQFADLSSSNAALPYFIVVPALAAGTHTIKIQHWTTGGSVQWSARTLLVLSGFLA